MWQEPSRGLSDTNLYYLDQFNIPPWQWHDWLVGGSGRSWRGRHGLTKEMGTDSSLTSVERWQSMNHGQEYDTMINDSRWSPQSVSLTLSLNSNDQESNASNTSRWICSPFSIKNLTRDQQVNLLVFYFGQTRISSLRNYLLYQRES